MKIEKRDIPIIILLAIMLACIVFMFWLFFCGTEYFLNQQKKEIKAEEVIARNEAKEVETAKSYIFGEKDKAITQANRRLKNMQKQLAFLKGRKKLRISWVSSELNREHARISKDLEKACDAYAEEVKALENSTEEEWETILKKTNQSYLSLSRDMEYFTQKREQDEKINNEEINKMRYPRR